MLINKSLNPEIINTFKDQQENILLVHAKINGSDIALGSIYGPNSTDRQFYRDLDNFINNHLGMPVLLGGDWNATWSNAGPEENIDITGMIRTPNVANGNLLKNLALKYDLTDPFRVLYPTKKAFSYSPFGATRTNKSRLDFFLASTSMLGNIQDCGIFPGKLSSQFDHKPIYINFNTVKTAAADGLKSWFLDDELVKISTEIAALQVYSKYINLDVHQQLHRSIVTALNSMAANITQIFKIREDIALKYNGANNFENLLLEAKYAEHRVLMADIPDWSILNNCRKVCDAKNFFSELTNHISARVSGTQKKLNRYKNL
jgi:hypothetical protein